MQEQHDLLDLLLLLPGGDNLASTILTDAGYFQQTLRFVFDDLESGFPEMAYDALGQLGPDALDHPRPEIALHARYCGRQHLFADFSLELLTMLGVVIPDPLYAQVFTGNEFRQVADNGDQTVKAKTRLMLAAAHFRTQAQHGVPVLRVVEGDAFD